MLFLRTFGQGREVLLIACFYSAIFIFGHISTILDIFTRKDFFAREKFLLCINISKGLFPSKIKLASGKSIGVEVFHVPPVDLKEFSIKLEFSHADFGL